MTPAWVRQSLTWFTLSHLVPQWYLEDRIRDGAGLAASVWRERFHGFRLATPPTDVATIDCPTILVWGEFDELLSHNDMEDLATSIPNSRLIVYEGDSLSMKAPDT